MDNIQLKCISCHKEYTKKTLKKYRGLYCKICFYDILIKENNDYKNINEKKSKVLSDEKNIKYKQILHKNGIFLDCDNYNNYEGLIKIYHENGNICYNGEWKKDIGANGKGKLYYIDDGSLYYDGEWINNKHDGHGKLYYEDESLSYDGMWKEDIKNGYGKRYNNNGSLLYDGEWKNNKFNGKGKKYNNGSLLYDGEWENNIRNGYGKLYYKNDGSLLYDGKWINDKFNGKGKK